MRNRIFCRANTYLLGFQVLCYLYFQSGVIVDILQKMFVSGVDPCIVDCLKYGPWLDRALLKSINAMWIWIIYSVNFSINNLMFCICSVIFTLFRKSACSEGLHEPSLLVSYNLYTQFVRIRQETYRIDNFHCFFVKKKA